MRVTAEGAVATAQQLVEMFRADRARIENYGRRVGTTLRVHEALKARPIMTVQEISKASGISFPAAASALKLLVEIGIASERTGKRRNRVFAYYQYLAALSEGTAPL